MVSGVQTKRYDCASNWITKAKTAVAMAPALLISLGKSHHAIGCFTFPLAASLMLTCQGFSLTSQRRVLEGRMKKLEDNVPERQEIAAKLESWPMKRALAIQIAGVLAFVACGGVSIWALLKPPRLV